MSREGSIQEVELASKHIGKSRDWQNAGFKRAWQCKGQSWAETNCRGQVAALWERAGSKGNVKE
jgi:hypothetical protein